MSNWRQVRSATSIQALSTNSNTALNLVSKEKTMGTQSARFLAFVTLLFVAATWVAGQETDPLAHAEQKQIVPARKGSGT